MSKQALVIYNPSSLGQSSPEMWLGEIVHRLCNEGGYNVSVLATQANMSHDSLDRQRLRASDLIVAAGGDGTIRLVLGAVAQMKSSVPVSIMPLGTGNQLARNLAIYEENILTDSLQSAIDIAL